MNADTRDLTDAHEAHHKSDRATAENMGETWLQLGSTGVVTIGSKVLLWMHIPRQRIGQRGSAADLSTVRLDA